jgi:hypothetical protein
MSTVAEAITVKRARLESVDVVRGVIMIIMALDHTRDFFGQPGSPTNLVTASIALFFTRWITNICAPVFFLLTGTGAWLSLGKRTKPELSRFLFTRGLWLIFLDLVLFRCLAVQFNFDYHTTVLTVLWALGWAMIALSVLIHLPASVVTTFGVVMVATHNLLDSIKSPNPLWSILHSPNVILATHRQGADVLLPASLCAHPRSRRPHLLRALRPHPLDVRVGRPRPLSRHSTSRMGTDPPVGLSNLVSRSDRNVSTLPLAFRSEATQQQPLAKLSLSTISHPATSAACAIRYHFLCAPFSPCSCSQQSRVPSRSRHRSPSKSK